MNISFVGFFFPFPFPFPLFTSFSAADTARILMFYLAIALDSRTYNWSCENTGPSKYTPTLGIVYPYALLMVIAKLSQIGNCFRLNWKGNISSSDGHKGIRGRKTRFLACCRNTISASMIFFWNPRMISLVPLQSPFVGSMFLSNMTGQPIFSFNTCGGRSLGVKVLRNSSR
jgi:hypothetical protein